MYWWFKQSKLQKGLILIAITSLAAGISGGKNALIGGIFLFILLLPVIILIPSKDKSRLTKEWRMLLKPRINSKERILRTILALIAIVISLISIYYLFTSLLREDYFQALLFVLLLFATLSSLVFLFPSLYNEIFSRSKIIPLSKKTNTKELYTKIEPVITPYGKPLLNFIEERKEPVGVFRIIDYNWIVYFYVEDDTIFIQAKSLFENAEGNIKWVYLFTQQLADLFAFYVNTNSIPDREEASKIFDSIQYYEE